jgi:beta-lactam-binding protein with PASTA domain
VTESGGHPAPGLLRTWSLRILRVVVPIALGFLAAAAVFNYVVMPRFVRHGQEVEVPEVTGKSLADARILLAGARLAVRDTVSRTDPVVPRGTVLEQDPRGGARIKPGRGVHLVVSVGRREEHLPAVGGQTLRFARLALGQDGYQLGDVLRVPSTEVPRNLVMASDPAGGSEVVAGARVSLLVSDGPPAATWILPDLRGEELQLTADKLRFAGFKVVITNEDPYSFAPRRIVSTDPPAGSVVSRGDTIRLVGG